MAIRVESEIGRLLRVLVHRPGLEIDWMVPAMMEHLLFDDILYGEEARREHGDFCEVMRRAGVETLYAGELLADVLEEEALRREIFERMTRHGLPASLIDRLRELAPARLAETLVNGVRTPPAEWRGGRRFYELAPIPNYFFQRDPQFVIGDRVMVSAMATEARGREPSLAEILFTHHPRLAGARDVHRVGGPFQGETPFGNPTLEGGDVVVAAPDVLVVGRSERSNRRGVELLADYLQRVDTPFHHLLFVELPTRRSFMHLDTVFTLIDDGVCLAHLPVVEPGHPLSAQVYRVDLAAPEVSYTRRPSLLAALAEVGVELEVVPCGGGDDLIDQEREQWTDGANAFALEPGVILLYRRNRRTIEELARRGWRILREVDVLEGGAEILGHGRTVVTFLGNELSRARGGPRCMTMPLEREPVESNPEPDRP